jgi:hypothetical protein
MLRVERPKETIHIIGRSSFGQRQDDKLVKNVEIPQS